jgi:hypothetical protein
MQIIHEAVGSGREELVGRVLDGFTASQLTDPSGCAAAKLVDVVNRSRDGRMVNASDVSVMQELQAVVRAAHEAVSPVGAPACVCVRARI